MAHSLAILLAAQFAAAAVVTDPIQFVDQLIGTSNGGALRKRTEIEMSF